MTGMTLYRRLCQQKEQVKNLFETLNIKKFQLDKRDVEVRAMSPVKELAKFGITVGVAGALGATGGGVCATGGGVCSCDTRWIDKHNDSDSSG